MHSMLSYHCEGHTILLLTYSPRTIIIWLLDLVLWPNGPWMRWALFYGQMDRGSVGPCFMAKWTVDALDFVLWPNGPWMRWTLNRIDCAIVQKEG